MTILKRKICFLEKRRANNVYRKAQDEIGGKRHVEPEKPGLRFALRYGSSERETRRPGEESDLMPREQDLRVTGGREAQAVADRVFCKDALLKLRREGLEFRASTSQQKIVPEVNGANRSELNSEAHGGKAEKLSTAISSTGGPDEAMSPAVSEMSRAR